ncbi:kappaPI-actitoxin-Avd3a-like [Centruroides sculpturatus]|uniref:kappaPI-actitoxin-Avd3a-like n=1 Tax=Centruroides sculpturatus TaxID=218467 RepID=UPI000C6C9083|nr:kappaPI-actitoxin-Avd3a-like [Centruroides sculpturatus]XP_023242639.1 kappaPI-actitoxin-Avd3a-like [Centruroides sculpturatus]
MTYPSQNLYKIIHFYRKESLIHKMNAVRAIFLTLFLCNVECYMENECCSLEKVVGPCKASMPGYFYNKSADECQNFIYGGCRGNCNRFAKLEECCDACGENNCNKQ